MCLSKLFLAHAVVDVFGNQVFSDESQGRLAETRFALKPLNPLYYSTTYFYSKAVSQSSIFSTNLSVFTIKLLKKPVEHYLDYLFETFSQQRHPCLKTYYEGGQFWGESVLNNPLEGKLYSNELDYTTISEKEVYQGKFTVTSKNFRYEGYLQNGIPHYFGSYFVNGVLVYKGQIMQGVPDGKGRVFSEQGQLLFDGVLLEGLPYLGCYYKLPRIFVGKFVIANKSNYKFIYKKLDMFMKSLKYENMLQVFTLEGEIFNYSPDVKVVRGLFSYDLPLLSGDFYLMSKEGKIYIGEMNGSKKEGLGLMLLPTGRSLLGRWQNNTFQGVYRQQPTKASENLVTDSDLPKREAPKSLKAQSVSRFDSVKRTAGFHKEPVEAKGYFKVKGDALKLIDYGLITFEDGSVYKGGISQNKMSGFGSMRFATGEHYEGMWKNNHMAGLGSYAGENFVYEGQFKNGLWNGFGILKLVQEKRYIKGEWDKGRLKYALIDEVPRNANFLQIEKMIVYVTEESNFFKTGKLELIGTSQVVFKEKSKKFDNLLLGAKSVAHTNESANLTDYRDASNQDGSPAKLQGGLQFFGEFTRLEKQENPVFKKDQIVGLGYIVKGNEVVFRGMVDFDFSNFFGVKIDAEEEVELRGHFNSNFKLNGVGIIRSSKCTFQGNFKKNLKTGLVIKLLNGQEATIGEYSEDKKNGYVLKKDTEPFILTEYVFGKLKRVFYNL